MATVDLKALAKLKPEIIGDRLDKAVSNVRGFNDNFVVGDAANQYIQENPNAGYNLIDIPSGQVTSRQNATQDYGALGNLAYGIISPFTNLGQVAGEIGKDPNQRGASESLLSEENFKRYKADPLAFTGQQAIGAASTFVPAGGTLLGAVAKGAAAGAGSAFSAADLTDENLDLGGELLKGAALGGGLGAIAKGVSSLASKGAGAADDVVTGAAKGNALTRAGRGLKKSALGLSDEVSPTGFQRTQQLADDAINILDSTGGKATPAGLNKSFSKLNNELATVVKGADTRFNPTSIMDDTIERLSLEVDDVAAGAVGKNVEVLRKKLANLGDSPTADQIVKLKSEVQGQMGNIYKKLSSGNAPLSPSEQATLAFRNSLDDAIAATLPEAKAITSQMSVLHQIAPDIYKNSQKGLKVGSPLLGTQLNLSGPVQGLKNAVGNVAERIGQGAVPGGGAVSRFADLANTAQQKAMLSSTIPAAVLRQPEGTPANPFAPEPMIEDPMLMEDEILAEDTGDTGMTVQEATQYFLNQGMSIKDAKEYGKVYGTEPKKEKELSGTEKEKNSNLNTGLRALNKIESVIAEDPSSLSNAFLPGILQSSSTRQLNTSISQLSDVIGRMRSGGAISEQEEARFRGFLPSTNPLAPDDPETIAFKLNEIKQLLSDALV